ncbi:ATP-binding protein [Bacillus sp. JJ1503]|uniref:ATP-binding protein n=1 Tax=Bacillus sp. JJ1503 TaxID=3122956 RepID=UPI002FFFCF3B
MKIINFINHSISNKVLSLFVLSFLFMIAGTSALFYFQHQAQNEYVINRADLDGKLQRIINIYKPFHSWVLLTQDSISIRVPINKEEADQQEQELRNELYEFGKLAKTNDETFIYQRIDSFITYYFTTVVPAIIQDYETTGDQSVDISDSVVSLQVKDFLNQMNLFVTNLQEQLATNANKFEEKESMQQYNLSVYLILFLLVLLFAIYKILKNIGKPLTEFTYYTNEIAAGRETFIKVDPTRKDELGMLSVAFEKMVQSIQDKEQDLVAHNEELIAQQDELQAQQQELQSTLEVLIDNQNKLKRINELINGISSSLDKREVLQSIIENMCKVTGSDKGVITFLYEEASAAYGVSHSGLKQFKRNLNSGLLLRLTTEKQGYTVRREQHEVEKGYHEALQYIYDLYLPVISSDDVKAVLVLTRYGQFFSNDEIAEYETLSKQIAIYLEKINLFEQSEEDRRLNQDILNNVQEGIQLIDKDRKIIQANQQLGDIFQNANSFKDLLGLSWNQWSLLMAEEIQENDFIDSLENLINSSLQNHEEEHSFIYRKKNSHQVIRVYCKTFKKDSDEDDGTLLVHRDITKEYEIAKMKSELVSTVSHELRTPLASVLGFSELLLNKELKPERKTKYLQTIYNEAKRLTALINDFLDIQRMESGKQTYEKKFIDITSILNHVIELQEGYSAIHQLNLSVELKETIILGDRMKIEQVFTNLLSNAIKYSPNGGDIFIRVYNSDDMLSVDIQDDGLGIPEDAIPKVFQQFYRVDNTDRRRIGGTGLGLAIVQEIVKAHDGVITVSSEFGKGSTFTTQFPHVMMKANHQNEEDHKSKLDYTIMIVEDDLSLAELLNHELHDKGFHVSCVNNGKDALKQMNAAPPDAIVLDIMLEDEFDGWTIMKEMKKSEKLKDIPIFVSTAIDDKEQGLSLGAQDYLVKPYKPSQLSKLIIETLINNEKNG